MNELVRAQVYIFCLWHSAVLISLSQLYFYNAAAESLSAVQGDIEELTVAAEGEYRCVTIHDSSIDEFQFGSLLEKRATTEYDPADDFAE